ncbi:MAG: 23S rRNA (uracil(1939)-C(5))-methyltransferase RlmD [Oscillospiraceae bacterium]|nr:23S rRNA (uracil(1939)-C(5))-methyltransferase RlmD [Oscillospiraceae bacterium]
MEIIKNKEYIVDIIDNGFEGEGIAKIDNFTVFVNNAIKGEKARILILKVNKNFAYGKVLEILGSSKDRQETECNVYGRCGGCHLRHFNYDATLKLKKEIVENCLYKALGKKIHVNDTIGMNFPTFYRNKLQYPIGLNKDNSAVMGVFAKRTHNIVSVSKCFVQDELSQNIANTAFEFIVKNNLKVYNENSGIGIFRHIVVKIGKKTNEVMVILVCNEESFQKENELVKELSLKFPEIKTIVKNINNKNTNIILGEKNIILYGDGYIYDILGEYKFKISPLSFYQVNPIQTEILYNKAIEMAELNKDDVVFDLYCGIGTIALFVSKYVKKVYGVEIVADAIADAKENAKMNDVNNVEFFAGDVGADALICPNNNNALICPNNNNALICPNNNAIIYPNVIFIDPPRKGLDVNTIENIIKMRPEKIVYISCNPATLARDVKLFSETYEIKDVQPIDMFPWTKHVECVELLERKTR